MAQIFNVTDMCIVVCAEIEELVAFCHARPWIPPLAYQTYCRYFVFPDLALTSLTPRSQ